MQVIFVQVEEAPFFLAYFTRRNVLELVAVPVKSVFFLLDFHDGGVQECHAGVVLYGFFSRPLFLLAMPLIEFVAPADEMIVGDFGIMLVKAHGVFAIIASMGVD